MDKQNPCSDQGFPKVLQGSDPQFCVASLQSAQYKLDTALLAFLTPCLLRHILNEQIFLSFRFQAPVAPNVSVLQKCIGDSISIAIVGFAVAFSVAKVYSIKHDYAVDGNQVGK